MNLESWIGRTESRDDVVTVAPIQALAATLDRDDPIPRPGDRLPLLWHWLYFLPLPRQSALGADGHERLGLFLPPVPLPRRLYAGGRIEVRHPLRVGEPVRRFSRIADVAEKAGRTGPLIFLKVRHEISNRTGLALVEEHDIVYRGLAGDAAGGANVRGAAPEDGGSPSFTREIVLDEVLLFRYSALTFNGYRIHYDRRYAIEVQGYRGLVVHAPLVATLLADLVRRHLPDADVASLSFRAHRPLFDGDRILLGGRLSEDGRAVKLSARESNGVSFEAEAVLTNA